MLCALESLLHEVSLDGSHPYTTIQSAIDVSNDGDTILVHPGTYFENINYSGKSITICSEYLTNPDWSVVESTIIDGNEQGSCVSIFQYEDNAYLDGITLTNGNSGFGGGIIQRGYSTFTVSNCIIEGNFAAKGGGIWCSSHSFLNLSGNVIRNNVGYMRGGGIDTFTGHLWFDPVSLNSVHNNLGVIQDICLKFSSSNDIVLDTLSVVTPQPDGYFVSFLRPGNVTSTTVTAQNGFIDQIDSDLYVSPFGDDNNDGLTEDTALRSIALANRKILSNSSNPNTVHILPGIYSEVSSNQRFPISLQSYTNMLGAGPDQTILGGDWGENSVNLTGVEGIDIGNFTIKRNNSSSGNTFRTYCCTDIYIHDVSFSENDCDYPGLVIDWTNNTLIESVDFSDIARNEEDFSVVLLSFSDNIQFNNLIANNIINNFPPPGGGNVCEDMISLIHSDVNLNNLIITNNSVCYDHELLTYKNYNTESINGNLEIRNALIYNNVSESSNLMLIDNRYNQGYLSNMTIANNSSPGTCLDVNGSLSIRNSIFFNTELQQEIGTTYSIFYPETATVIDIDFCNVNNGLTDETVYINDNDIINWGIHNINENPLFRGDINGDIPIDDPRWVQLSANSPCIDAGTPDTLGMNLPTLDITGNDRVWDGIIDIGAHEYNPTVESCDETVPTPPNKIAVSHYPNPITPNGSRGRVALIEFTLPKETKDNPSLEIFNINGQKVRDLKINRSFSQLIRSAGLSSDEKQTGEYYSQVWDCKDNYRKSVASGIYFYKVSCDDIKAVGKMMVVK